MIFKAMIIPLVLIICFGGSFVALTKPFNLKATTTVFGLALAVLAYGYTHGIPKVIAAIAIVACLIALFSGKLRK